MSDPGTARDVRARRFALAAVCGVLFLTFLDTTIVSVALADLQSTLHAGVTSLQWVVNGYALPFASLMLVAGIMGDRFGRKRVMLVGIVLFCAGSFLGALAPNVGTLIAARAIMGTGAAASEPATLSVIRQIYPNERSRARALGTWGAVSGLALALGPVIGGMLVGIGGWRAVFWFNLAAGLLALAWAWVAVPESADPQPAQPDLAGFILAPLALGALTFAVIVGEGTGYAAPGIVALFVVGAALGMAFLIFERRARPPMLDLSLLRVPPFSGALLVAFSIYFGVFSIFFFTALYVQVVVEYSGFRTAALFLPMCAAMVVASTVAGRWVARSGARIPMVLGCAAAGTGILLTRVALGGHFGFLELAAPLALGGLGFGIAVVPVTSVALAVVPASNSGMAASATNTSRELGAVVGVAVLGSLVNGRLASDLTARLVHLGVPSSFQGIVIDAIEHGQIPGASGIDQARLAYGPIVIRVINAAYAAFHAGLDIALTVSGITILVSGAVAWFALGDRRTVGPLP
jgi:EmrB/QacA subfamily drug resistance transporter